MSTYVFIFGFCDFISGGPIYDCNKIRYLKEKGWNIVVIPIGKGKVYIEPLKEYLIDDKSNDFLFQSPYVFSKKELKQKIDIMQSYINDFDNVIIETGTDYTAQWGELLAERINAKHIIMFLDEMNAAVNVHTYKFYKFKYDRNELASISDKSLEYIFSPFFHLYDKQNHILDACCTNSVQDVECDWKEKIPNGDFIIGSIGRLEKNYVKEIVKGICEFAENYSQRKITVLFLGGSDESVISELREDFSKVKNIKVYISGYIWPIPKSVIESVDVFVSGAGSARVSANCGKPTIRMDVINGHPMGFVVDVTSNWSLEIDKNNPTLKDYLVEALINKNVPKIKNSMSIEKQWNWICDCFDEHMKFIENSNGQKEYFPVQKMWDGTWFDIIKKFVFKFVNFDTYYKLRNNDNRN